MPPSPLPERKYLKRREAEKFWQFQYENDPIKESKTFYDKDFGSRDAALEEAQRYRDEFLRTAHDLGITGPDGKLQSNDLPIQLTLSPRNKSGIIGLYRESLQRARMRIPEMNWIANYKDDAGKNKQRGFSVKGLGEKGALLQALRFRRDYVAAAAKTVTAPPRRALVEHHVEELDLLIEYIDELVEEDDLYFFLSTINNPAISATEKNAELAIRVGQARFRKLVLAMWNGECAVTRATHFLVASHIKPWAVSNDTERLDPHNGIALSPVYDKAFDSGLITFNNDGSIVVSPLLRFSAPLLGISGTERITRLSERHEQYLEHHRTKRFRRE